MTTFNTKIAALRAARTEVNASREAFNELRALAPKKEISLDEIFYRRKITITENSVVGETVTGRTFSTCKFKTGITEDLTSYDDYPDHTDFLKKVRAILLPVGIKTCRIDGNWWQESRYFLSSLDFIDKDFKSRLNNALKSLNEAEENYNALLSSFANYVANDMPRSGLKLDLLREARKTGLETLLEQKYLKG